MKVQHSIPQINNINFKGHETKRLDTILVHRNKSFGADAILQQLDAIATRHRVSVEPIKYYSDIWIQDQIYFTPNRKVISPNYRYATGYADSYGLEPDELINNTNPYRTKHVEGGNIFFVKDKDGRQVILTAKNADGKCELDGYENCLGPDKVIALPHADYHADLFITPIGDNKILVANDNLMLEGLDRILEACVLFVADNPDDKSAKEIEKLAKKLLEVIESFEESKEKYKFKGCDEKTAQILKDNGFEVIPVPSRVYYLGGWKEKNSKEKITHLLNYSNSITYKDRSNEPVLIAAKSGLEKKIGLTPEIAKKIGIDFESLFKEAVAPHIKPENVHFIQGDTKRPISDILEENKGGLHCMCVEVPDYYEF